MLMSSIPLQCRDVTQNLSNRKLSSNLLILSASSNLLLEGYSIPVGLSSHAFRIEEMRPISQKLKQVATKLSSAHYFTKFSVFLSPPHSTLLHFFQISSP